MTINGTWGFKSFDTNFKSDEVLLRNLIDIASKGGNYLLNIGPDAKGIVPEPERERLLAMGKWLSVNGEAIYGTNATLFTTPTGSFSETEKDKAGKPKFLPSWNWRSTTGKDKVYVEIFAGQTGTLHLGKLDRKVTGAYWLATKKPATFTQTAEGLDVPAPTEHADAIATVLVLKTVR